MVNVRVEGVARAVNNLERFQNKLRQEQKKNIREASVYLMNYIQRNKLSGQVLSRRTGHLAGSIKYTVEESGTSFMGRVGSSLEYSAIHETGGTITAKRAKYLTIPLQSAMTPAGVVRKPARKWADTFVRKISNNLFIFSKESGRPVPIFLLKKSVKIPKRPYIAPALEETKSKLIDIIKEAVEIAVRVGNGEG